MDRHRTKAINILVSEKEKELLLKCGRYLGLHLPHFLRYAGMKEVRKMVEEGKIKMKEKIKEKDEEKEEDVD